MTVMDRVGGLVCVSLLLFVFIEIVEPKTCWDKQWYNTSVPLTNGSEFEGLSQTDRAALCYNNGPIAAQCADSRHEGFTGNKTEPKLKYNAICDLTHGLICHPFQNTTAKCPDLAIQYGCDCQHTGPPGQPASTSTKRPITSTAQPLSQQTNNVGSGSTPVAGQGQNKKQKGRDNGAERGQAALTLMVGCIVMLQYFFV